MAAVKTPNDPMQSPPIYWKRIFDLEAKLAKAEGRLAKLRLLHYGSSVEIRDISTQEFPAVAIYKGRVLQSSADLLERAIDAIEEVES